MRLFKKKELKMNQLIIEKKISFQTCNDFFLFIFP